MLELEAAAGVSGGEANASTWGEQEAVGAWGGGSRGRWQHGAWWQPRVRDARCNTRYDAARGGGDRQWRQAVETGGGDRRLWRQEAARGAYGCGWPICMSRRICGR